MARTITLVLLIALRAAQCAPCTEWARLPVKLFNDASVGNEVLYPAKEEAAFLLKSICVEVTWVPCRVVSRSNLTACEAPVGAIELHVLSNPVTNDFGEDTLGIAIPRFGSGDHAGVFLSRVRQKAAQNAGIIDVPDLLGYVMVHEIGHLLLHSTAHSSEGLMRADLRQRRRAGAVKRRSYQNQSTIPMSGGMRRSVFAT